MWTEEKLNEMSTTPSDVLVEDIKKIDGDIMILGAGGKMGYNLCVLAKNAVKKAGVNKRVIAVSRFSDEYARNYLVNEGVEIIPCDLLVLTCSTWLHLAPADANIVVSEIGETWSPNTAPPRSFTSGTTLVIFSGKRLP